MEHVDYILKIGELQTEVTCLKAENELLKKIIELNKNCHDTKED